MQILKMVAYAAGGSVVVGLLLFLDQLSLPLLDVGLVLGRFGGDGGGVDAGLKGEKVDIDRQVVHADLLCLVEVPLIAGAGLHEHGLGVTTMAEYADHGDKDGKDGDAEGDGLERFVTFAGFLHLVGKFVDFVGFHSGMILACGCGDRDALGCWRFMC